MTLKDKCIKRVKEIMRFGIVGVVATVIHYGCYRGLMLVSDAYNIAYTIGYGTSLLFNFVASNYFTFKVKPTVTRSKKFLVAHCINYVLQIVLLNGLIMVHVSEEIAPLIVFVVSVGINFFMVRKALVD